jgi:hypothetical protein
MANPVQHTPAHVGNVVDERHPAASAFAPLQPAAGVVADDVDERGQNLAKGPKASQAEKDHQDQPEKLAQAHADTLRTTATTSAPTANVEGTEAKPAKSSSKK